MKPRDIKILVFSTILVLFGVLCYFLSLRTLNALVNNPDLLGRLDYHSARRYYWASLAVLTISSVPFVGILLSDRYPLSKHLTRGDMYFLIIVSRLILIIILEYFYIQVYMDLPYYLAYPVSQFEGTSFAPLSVACYSFLRFQQEIVFRWHGSPFLPGQELYLPLLLRINNLVLEIICIYIIEKIYRDYVQKKGQKPLKDRISGDIKSKNHEDINILFYFLVFPITLLISYVWVTVDLFLVLLMLWAIWESYKNLSENPDPDR